MSAKHAFGVLPFILIFFLPQNWGFYSGNATETVVVRYKFTLSDNSVMRFAEQGLKAAIPYRFVIGGSEGNLASNNSRMTEHVLKYYCNNPYPRIFNPKSVALESAKVTFPRLDKPIPNPPNFTSEFTQTLSIDCTKQNK